MEIHMSSVLAVAITLGITSAIFVKRKELFYSN